MTESYEVVVDLFKALDQSIRDQKAQRTYYESKEQLEETMKYKLGLKGWFKQFYVHMSLNLPENARIQDKIALRKNIMKRIHDFQDQKIIK